MQAVRYGAAAGAVSTTRVGAQNSMPTGAEVSQLPASKNGKALRAGRGTGKVFAGAAMEA
jgi:hypothetical protein